MAEMGISVYMNIAYICQQKKHRMVFSYLVI